MVEGRYAAAHGKGNVDAAGNFAHQVHEGAAPLLGGADVKVHQFVGALPGIADPHSDGVANLAKPFEMDAFNHLPVFYIEAGYDSFCDHNAISFNVIRFSYKAFPTMAFCKPAASSARISSIEDTPPLTVKVTCGKAACNWTYSPVVGPCSMPSRPMSVTIASRSSRPAKRLRMASSDSGASSCQPFTATRHPSSPAAPAAFVASAAVDVSTVSVDR